MRLSVGVLVTDGEHRASLAVVRSLGQAGCDVHVCARRASSLAGVSRHARSSFAVPDPLAEPGAFVDALADACRRLGVHVLLPITEASLLALLPSRERFGKVRLPFPPAATFRAICDKDAVLERARSLGISVPRQVVVRCPEEAAAWKAHSVPRPVVLKPSRSVAEDGTGRIQLGVRHAADREELTRTLRALPPQAFPVLVQQRIAGPGVGIFLLPWQGHLLAAFAHRRIREKPPSGGVSVYRESILLDPELATRSRRLLEAYGWEGVAMVEYKVDDRTDEAYLMEVNGRFWGSLQLAIDAGVDFPALLVAAAMGREPEPVTEYQTGIRSRWWWGDVDHLLLRLRRSARELALPPGAPGQLRTLLEFLTIRWSKDINEVLRLSDPKPFVHESLSWFGALFSRRSNGGS